MKKILAVCILLAVSLSLVGCGRVYTSCTSQILYNENGEPVQVFVYDSSLNLDGQIYNVYQEDGEYYVNAKINFNLSGKVKLPVTGTIEVNGSAGLSEIGKIFDGSASIDFVPADSGENFYQGEPVLNFYYLDTNADYPIAVLTDSFEGEVLSVILSPITYTDGNEYIVLSNDEGEYIYVPFDMDDPDTMLEQMAGYTTPSRKEFYYVDSINYDENNNPVSAVVLPGYGPIGEGLLAADKIPDLNIAGSELSSAGSSKIELSILSYTFDVYIDDAGQAYLAIPDVNGGDIYAAFDIEDVGNGNIGICGAIIVPRNIVDLPEETVGGSVIIKPSDIFN